MTDPKNPVELAQALIRCRSITPEEGGALTLLRDVLKEAGFETFIETFSEPGTPDVANLYARIGTTGPVLLLAGHTDVVPPGDVAAWSVPPFAGEVKGDSLYGRGAVDMKGGLAAMISAAVRYLSEGGGTTKGSIAFLVTGDEEGPSVNGTPKILKWALARGETFDHCLLAEPSSVERVGDEIKIGRRGSVSGILTVHGTQGHVAYPKQADNPIRRLLPLLNALGQPLDYGTANFERTNLEITSVDTGNETVNIIPSKVTARFNVRYSDAHTLDSLKTLIAERLERAAGDTRYDLEFLPGASSSFVAEPGPFVDMVVSVIREETGARPKLSTGGGTSDARYIKDACPVVEFGLRNATMHQVDERVSLSDLETATRIYQRLLARYFGAQIKLEPADLVAAVSAAVVEPPVQEPAQLESLQADFPEPPANAISVESDLEALLEAELNLTGTEAQEEAASDSKTADVEEPAGDLVNTPEQRR